MIGNLAQIEKMLEQGLDLDQASKSADELAAEVKQLEEAEEAARQPPLRSRPRRLPTPRRTRSRRRPRKQKAAEELAKADAIGEFAGRGRCQAERRQGRSRRSASRTGRHGARSAAELGRKRRKMPRPRSTRPRPKSKRHWPTRSGGRRRSKSANWPARPKRSNGPPPPSGKSPRKRPKPPRTKGLEAKKAEELAAEQAEVGKVAEKIAEGVKNTAPEAAQMLAQAKPSVERSRQATRSCQAAARRSRASPPPRRPKRQRRKPPSRLTAGRGRTSQGSWQSG